MKKINLEKISYFSISLSIFILIGIGGGVACGDSFPFVAALISIALYVFGKIVLWIQK